MADVLVATAFQFGVLALVWIGFLAGKVTVRIVLTLGLGTFLFGPIYSRAVFPISQFTYEPAVMWSQ